MLLNPTDWAFNRLHSLGAFRCSSLLPIFVDRNTYIKHKRGWEAEVWICCRIHNLVCSHTPWCSTHNPFLIHLILPEEFNLLPRVPSHNFFKSTFYETAIPFHRGALYSKSYLQSVICGHINMTKVPVCSPVLCSRSHYYHPAEASLWDAAVPTHVHQGSRSG